LSILISILTERKVYYTCFYRFKDDLAHKWKGWVVTTGGDGLGSISQVGQHSPGWAMMDLQLGWYGKAWLGYVGHNLGSYIIFKSWLGCPHLEFLDINLTKDSIFLINAFHSPLYWRVLKKTILYFGFKNIYKISTKHENSNIFMNSIQ
jgi:hypothetical protein